MKERFLKGWVWAVAAVSVGWLAFAGFFYYKHNPLSKDMLIYPWTRPFMGFFVGPEQLVAQAGRIAWASLILILLTILAYSVGRVLLVKLLRMDFVTWKSRLVFGVAIGYGTLAYLILGLGLCGLLYPAVMAVLAGAGLVSLVWLKAWKNIPDLWKCARQDVGQLWKTSRWLCLALTMVFLLNFLAVFIPDSEYDALVYHLSAPQVYLMNHKIVNMPLQFSTFTPMLSEMLYCLGLGVSQQAVTQGMDFIFYFLLFLLFLEIGERVSLRLALLACVLFFTNPFTAMVASRVYIDVNLAFWTTLCLWVFFKGWVDKSVHLDSRGRVQAVVLLSLCLAFAMGTKLTGVFTGLGLGLAMLYLGVRRREGAKAMVRDLVLFSVLAGLIFSPWLIRNYAWTGNPVFHFLYAKLGGVPWTEFSEKLVQREYSQYNQGYQNLADYLVAPWQFLVLKKGTSDNSGQGLGLLIFLGLGLFFLARQNRFYYFNLGAGLFLGIVWFVTCQHVRFLLPAFPALCFVGAVSFQSVESLDFSWQPWWKKAWGAVFSIIALLSAVQCWQQVGYGLGGPGGVCAGVETRESYLKRVLRNHFYEAYERASQYTEEGKRILILGDDRGFYLDKPYVLISLYYPYLKLMLDESKDQDDIYKKLKELHADYILYDRRLCLPDPGPVPYL